MKTITTSFVVLFVLIINSCTGPQGEPGPQGATGLQGSTGPAGPQGTAGKISFYATEWIKSDNEYWINNYVPADLTTAISLIGDDIDKLTQADLNGGIILVYDTYLEDKSIINAWPYDYVFGERNHVWFSYGAGITDEPGIYLYTTFAKDIDPVDFFVDDTWYRVIIIPALSGARLKGLDLKDYQAVKLFLGLKD